MELDARAPFPASEPDDRDRLRQELEATREELRVARNAQTILDQITRSAKDFAIILLTPDGRVLHWNDGAERLLGYGQREILGQSADLLFTPEDRARNAPREELRRAEAEGRADDECWLQRKDGSRFWASGVSTPVRRNRGELEGFVKVLRDQSARKQLEDELRRVNATLEDRIRERTADLEDALKEMGAFSYSIAHDLRAPLRAMSGFAELLDSDHREQLAEGARDYLRRITEAAALMDRMIEDLLTYSRMTRTEVLCHSLDPGLALDQVLHTLEPEIAARKAEVTVERPLPLVLAHEVTLVQVFSNLLTNALKFVAPGVVPRIRVRGEVQADWVRIWVEDNGIGVPPEYQKRIFGIFERLHGATEYPGTGIGLAIVNRAVERMRGRIGVEPALVGTGSRFWVDLRKVA
ncbi:MAG: PAS domain S-box protein [Planctomycetaceae bacterium]|nr:PAS domain S-box protein [Planctomycetaceae bacterium]